MDLRVKRVTVSAALVNALKRERIIGKGSRIVGKDSSIIGRDRRSIGKDSRIIGKDSKIIGEDSKIIGKDSRGRFIGLLVWTEVLHTCALPQSGQHLSKANW